MWLYIRGPQCEVSSRSWERYPPSMRFAFTSFFLHLALPLIAPLSIINIINVSNNYATINSFSLLSLFAIFIIIYLLFQVYLQNTSTLSRCPSFTGARKGFRMGSSTTTETLLYPRYIVFIFFSVVTVTFFYMMYQLTFPFHLFSLLFA